jgi:hypothetical protein
LVLVSFSATGMKEAEMVEVEEESLAMTMCLEL